jgi:hypothetical protein
VDKSPNSRLGSASAGATGDIGHSASVPGCSVKNTSSTGASSVTTPRVRQGINRSVDRCSECQSGDPAIVWFALAAQR